MTAVAYVEHVTGSGPFAHHDCVACVSVCLWCRLSGRYVPPFPGAEA